MPYIPGIYNYCDRWCERCRLNTRCRVYAMEGPPAEKDEEVTDKAFLKEISVNLEKAARFLRKAAAHYGTNPIDERAVEETGKRKKILDQKVVGSHQLSVLSKEYLIAAKKFLDKTDVFQDKANAIFRHCELGLTTDQSAIAVSMQLKESVDVVHWYLYFIHIKFIRALSSKSDEDAREEDDFQKDSDGSASIALIGVQRSIEAWYGLYEQLCGNEDEILSILSILSKIKSEGERIFPGAATFKRPGFDD